MTGEELIKKLDQHENQKVRLLAIVMGYRNATVKDPLELEEQFKDHLLG